MTLHDDVAHLERERLAPGQELLKNFQLMLEYVIANPTHPLVQNVKEMCAALLADK